MNGNAGICAPAVGAFVISLVYPVFPITHIFHSIHLLVSDLLFFFVGRLAQGEVNLFPVCRIKFNHAGSLGTSAVEPPADTTFLIPK